MKYETVRGHGLTQHTQKKSRFIGEAYPVSTEEEARALLEETKKRYWDASHTCFAFRVGLGGKAVSRFSDAGEPSGTAGKPILDVIEGWDLTNVLVLVTRYFGGTLLGTGGLTRAYSEAARIAVDAAGTVLMEEQQYLTVAMDDTDLGKMQYQIGQKGLAAESVVYADKVTMGIWVPLDQVSSFEKMVVDLSFGRLKAEEGQVLFKEVRKGGK